jgi:glycosyltransferase involved in cell wall biosynthesis
MHRRPRARPYRQPSFRTFCIIFALAHAPFPFVGVRGVRFVVRSIHSGAELSILMVIYNKWSYLNRSLSSIANLSLSPARYEVLCVDDGSTDNSTRVVGRFFRLIPSLRLIRHGANLGTHRARITAVRNARAPFLTFLDPDDEFAGAGLELALDAIEARDADIVEFGCHTVLHNETIGRCWLRPRTREAEPGRYARMYYRGRINSHVHRKVIRTELYQRALRAMPPDVLDRRLIRYEDKLHYAFIIANMTRKYYYINVLGELRYWGLEDNSQTETYQSINETVENDEYVTKVIYGVFGKVAR